MPLSLVHDGKVLDWRFETLGDKWHYAFYCGDIYMGQVFKMRRGEWCAVPKTPTNWGPYNGFRSRYHACELILKVNGYWGQYPGKVYVYDQKTLEDAAQVVEEYGEHAAKIGIVNWSVLCNKIRSMFHDGRTTKYLSQSGIKTARFKSDSSGEDGA